MTFHKTILNEIFNQLMRENHILLSKEEVGGKHYCRQLGYARMLRMKVICSLQYCINHTDILELRKPVRLSGLKLLLYVTSTCF